MENCVLPEDIVFCILTRLPVKSIVCFKSVCKSWKELFSTSCFVQRHREARSSSGPQSFFLECREYDPNLSILDSSTGTIADNVYSEPHPGTEKWDFVGCINGLVCLSYRNAFDIIMWNPALKLFKVVKLLKHSELSSESIGFGYDGEGDNFKVVRLLRLKDIERGEERIVSGAEVYSANSDSWMTVEVNFRFSILWSRPTSSAVVNGNPYWEAIVYCPRREALVRFDAKKMVFEILPTLNLKWDDSNSYVAWKGSLGAIAYDKQRKSIDVWLFGEGDRTWTKNHLLTIGMDCVSNLQISNNGATILVWGSDLNNYKRLVLALDPNTGAYWKLISWPYPNTGAYPKLISWPDICGVYPYTESLVHIRGMKHL